MRPGKTYKLKFLTANVGDVHIVGRWAEIFQLLTSKNIQRNQMHLCVAVFACLGRRHLRNFAGAILNHDEAVLAQSRALHRIRRRGASIDALERMLLMLWWENIIKSAL